MNRESGGLHIPHLLPDSIVFLAGAVVVLCCAGWAQVASITGVVVDPSGAVISGATVVGENPEGSWRKKCATGEDGSFSLPVPTPGNYQLRIEAPGFEPYVENDLVVDGSAPAGLNVRLALISARTTVEVTADRLQIDLADTERGETIGTTKMTSVPLNGRSFTDLLGIQSGIVPNSSQQPNAVVMSGVTSTPPSGDLNAGNLSISGQRETSNGFRVNGSDVEEDVNMGAAIVPNLDSVQEFRVLTNNFDAQYGNYSGGQVLLMTKAGTNQFHGDVFEFLRNTNLDARNYFSTQRAQFSQNQFGGTLGGPIRRDKVFFFADYQGTQMTQGIDTGRISVPSFADRTGNLSDLAGSLTGTVNGQAWAQSLWQRLGYPVYVGERYYTPGCTRPSECVLPNARIPEAAWTVPSKVLLRYIPMPNEKASAFSTSAFNQSLRDDKSGVRIDADTFFGSIALYYFVDDYALNNPYPTGVGGASVPGFNAMTFGRAQLLSFATTKAIGTTALNELHFSYMRSANNAGEPIGGVGPSLASQGFVDSKGAPGIVPLAPKIEGVENVSFNDFTFGLNTTGLTQANNTFQWMDNFSRIIGKHTLRVGGESHFDQINTHPNVVFNGAFLFQGTETGVDFADFLLGIASSYTQGDSQPFYNRNRYIGVFAQDTWKLKSNLRLDYGLRWDVISPWYEKYNQLQTLILGEQSRVYPGAPQGLVFPGDAGVPRSLAPTKYDNVAPRIGVSFSPDAQNGMLAKLLGANGASAIRAGYGLYYTAFEGLSAGIMSANPPYGYTYSSVAPPLFATPFVTAASGQSVGQRFPLNFPPMGASTRNPNANVDWSQYLPITGVPSFFHGNVPPYTESYTLSLERQVTPGTLLSVSYVGSEAHHLLVLTSANPGNPALCMSLSQPNEVMPGTPTCGPFGESGTYIRSSGAVVRGTRGPFSSQFAAVTYQKTMANSDYNALQINLRHNSGPLEFMAGYTYSKSLDESSSLAEAVNPINPELSRALSAFDMRHNFVVSYNWRLPVNKLLHRENQWTQGWAVSGVSRFATGFPVTLFNNNDTSLLGTIPNGINNNGVDTPNVAPGILDLNTNPRHGAPAFNTALFSLPSLGQLGNSPRRFFDGPGIYNFDMAVQKNVRFSESKFLELRLEAFNFFNHAQFYGPAAVNGNISSANFGEVISAAAPRLMQCAAKFYF
ncbi:MAG TPA: carboxypeptidase regulatory-like domain-containing protein [Terriglobales bacterium]|nr:carboxypeptidase regulatory-like domain-containing protein [Terriglobales bacterium]